MLYFAHEGHDHAAEAQTATNDSNTIVWVLLAIVVVAAMLYALNKVFSRRKK